MQGREDGVRGVGKSGGVAAGRRGNFYEVVSRKLPNELRSSVLVIVFVELDGVALLVADPPPANSTTLNVTYFVFLIG